MKTLNLMHNLGDHDRKVLGIQDPTDREADPSNLTHRELTERYMVRCRLSFSDAQNAATVLLSKMTPQRPKTVATAPQQHVIAAGIDLLAPRIEDLAPPTQDKMAEITAFYTKNGFDFETAQNLAVRHLSAVGEPADQVIKRLVKEGVRDENPTFNPGRDAAYLSEPARQENINAIYRLTALLQGPGAEGRDAIIRMLGNNNLLATFTAIANSFITNMSVCQTWAQRCVAHYRINGARSYADARAEAEKLVQELARVGDKLAGPFSPGVGDPRIGSPTRRGELSPRGPVTAGGLPVDITAATRAMQATDPVSESFYRAKAFAADARTRGGR